MKPIITLLVLAHFKIVCSQSNFPIEISALPSPLEIHADSIEFEMRFRVPPRNKFSKSMNYRAEITFSDFAQAHFEIDCSKYPAMKKMGMDTSVTFRIPYLSEMENGELNVLQSISKKGKIVELPTIRDLAQCCINTSTMLPTDFELIELSCSNTFRTFAKINYHIQPRTDEKIKKIANEFIVGSFAGDLKKTFEKEEWLHAVCLCTSTAHKKILLEAFHDVYPNESRALNDLAVIDLKEGSIQDGLDKLYLAQKLTAENILIENNIRAGNALHGDYLIPRSNSLPNTNTEHEAVLHYNDALIYAQLGQYTLAVNEFSKATTIPASKMTSGLCRLLLGDYAVAKIALMEALELDEENPKVHYLLAIAYARTNELNALLIELKMACILDGRYKTKASNDLEFRNYWSNDDFLLITTDSKRP